MAVTLDVQHSLQDVGADDDWQSDVFYIIKGPARPIEGDGLPRGVEIGFDLYDGAPCAVTVIGFDRNGWLDTIEELVTIASTHLCVPASEIDRVITAALDRSIPQRRPARSRDNPSRSNSSQ